jgi:hypothetical protein
LVTRAISSAAPSASGTKFSAAANINDLGWAADPGKVDKAKGQAAASPRHALLVGGGIVRDID